MEKEIRIINDSEYAQMLQQAVAEIQASQATIARQVSSTINSVYWILASYSLKRT